MKEYKLPDNTYFTVRSYMIRDLHLKGNELLVYAIIDGFSHDGQSKFVGGISYLCAMTSSTKANMISCLKNLREKGLIDRVEIKIGNIEKHSYFVTNVSQISGKQSKPEDEVSGKQSEHGSGKESKHGAGKESKPIIEEKENNGSNFLPHPNLVPNNLESDGTKIPSEPLVVENHSKSEIGGYSKSVQASKAPQPPDVKKYASDFSQLLRKKFPKDEMYKFLDEVSLDIPTISEMFVEYWIYQRSREFLIRNENNLFAGFREWIKIAKTKEIPAKETTSGIKSKPIMEKVLHEVGKKKRMTLSPTDAGKVNKFIAESGVSDKALEYGTKNFCNGSGNTWDAWILVVGNAIKSEKLGEI